LLEQFSPENLALLSDEELDQLCRTMDALVRDDKKRELERYDPYPKQLEFHNAGKTHRERLFMAGNQLGKTLGGSMEVAMHLTGRYPDWFEGKRFEAPIRAWAAGVTGESTRDNPQRLLLGPVGDWGTGSIPGDLITHTQKASHGVAELLDYITVRHISGGTSFLAFKSYEKGREKWQGESLELIWFDEEPPSKIYAEGLTRTQARGGITMITFTPLLGMSDVVSRFLMEESEDRHVTQMTIDDAAHYTDKDREMIVAGYLEHEREARARGVPVMGSGMVYPVTEGGLQVKPFAIPDYWPRIAGIDFGWDDHTAVVYIAWDRDTDNVYVYDCYKVNRQTPAIHAVSIKGKGSWIPVAWPADGYSTEKGSGKSLMRLYKEQDVNMLFTHASYEDDRKMHVEPGIMDILDRMKRGGFHVFTHLNDWFDEFRLYHREDGKIYKKHDHLMDATRYAVMMLRFAQTHIPIKRDRYEPRQRRKTSYMSL